jgi:hypothetical protein
MCDETKFHDYFRLSQYVLRILLVKPQNGSYNQDIRCRKQSHKNSVNAANTQISLVSLTLRANNTAPYHIIGQCHWTTAKYSFQRHRTALTSTGQNWYVCEWLYSKYIWQCLFCRTLNGRHWLFKYIWQCLCVGHWTDGTDYSNIFGNIFVSNTEGRNWYGTDTLLINVNRP